MYNQKIMEIMTKVQKQTKDFKINVGFDFLAFQKLIKQYNFEKHVAFDEVLKHSTGNENKKFKLDNYNFSDILETIKCFDEELNPITSYERLYDCNLLDYFFIKLSKVNFKIPFKYDLNNKLLKYDYNKQTGNFTILVNDNILIDPIYYEIYSIFNLETSRGFNHIIVNTTTKSVKSIKMLEKYVEEINKDTFRCSGCGAFEWLNLKVSCNNSLVDFCSNCYEDNDINNCIDAYGHPEIDATNEDMADFYGGTDI